MQETITNSETNKPLDSIAAFDIQTKDRIRKHLSDINDVITEEDIKNIRTDIYDNQKTDTPNI